MKTETENTRVNSDNLNLKKHVTKGSNLSYELSYIFRKFLREEIVLFLNEDIRKGNTDSQIKFAELASQTTIVSKLGWLGDSNALLKLYEILLSHGFLACKFETFKNHFTGSEEVKDFLVWLSDVKQLAYLFSRLIDMGFVPEARNKHKLLSDHFLNVNDNRISAGCFRSSLSDIRNGKSNPKVRVIEAIISQLF